MSYLAQLLAGYRHGLTLDLPESHESTHAALVEGRDAYWRGVLLGILATSLTQRDRSVSKIDEAAELQRVVIEAIRLSVRPRLP